MRSVFRGWICRTWTERYGSWTSEFERFATEEEARAHGRAHLDNIGYEDTAREFEIYKDYDLI